MDLTKLATDLVMKQLGGNGNNVSQDTLASSLGSLLGDGDGINLGSIVSQMTGNGGLSDLVGSWLGDGDNQELSSNQLTDILGKEKLSQFSNNVGMDEGSVLESLRQALPQIIDKSSSGGSLLDGLDLGDALNLAKKLF